MSEVSDRPAAIVTGAGSGIGRAAAIKLSEAGFSLLLVGRTASKLRQTAGLLDSAARAEIYPIDVTDPTACQAAIGGAMAEYGRLDALCNIAGHAQQCSIEETGWPIWRQTIETNAGAVLNLTRAAWPLFRRCRGGIIVNVSSMASLDPFPLFAAYAAAKAAVNMLTRVTASEGEAIGLRAVAVAPGAVETPMLRNLFDEAAIPASATLDPAVVGSLIADLAAGRRPFESGQVITLEPPGAA